MSDQAVYTSTCLPRLSKPHRTVHCPGEISAKMPRKPLRIILVQYPIRQCTLPPAFHGSPRYIALYTAQAIFRQRCHASHSASFSSKTPSGSVHPDLPSTALHGVLHCTPPPATYGSPRHIALYTAQTTFRQRLHPSHSTSFPSRTPSGSVHPHLPPPAVSFQLLDKN